MNSDILMLLKKESPFYASQMHGVKHWRSVESNGLYLADFNDADKAVVSYFSYFHDCMRENEHEDFEHGLRGSIFAKRHRKLINLNENQFQQLLNACEGHTTGERPSCITINTCWDADRLDIGRVGIRPSSQYLHTAEAKRIADENDFEVLRRYHKSIERDSRFIPASHAGRYNTNQNRS